MKKTTIGLIGGGNMGTAILAGIGRGFSVRVCETDVKRARFLQHRFGARVMDFAETVRRADVVILAVKPQNFEDVLSSLRPFVEKRHLIVSIAAGITCRYIEKRLAPGIRVVRAMPNLPAQAGEGMTALCAGKEAGRTDLALARRIFDCVGRTMVVEEKRMDAVTAVSGSGPAYVFLFAECLEKAARSLGFPEVLARELAAQTLKGSVRLWEQSGEGPEVLRARVTSKGGTTQAAMDVFSKYHLERIFQEALKAAAKRAKELAK